MRRAIGVAMALLFSLPLLAGTVTSISPSSIVYKSGEHFLTAYGTGFSASDRFIFYDTYNYYELTVNSYDSTAGSLTGWVPQEVVNDPGTWSFVVRSGNGDSAPVNFTVTKPGRLPLQIHLPELIAAVARSPLGTGIKYDVYTTGGDGTTVTVSCDPASGSTFPFGLSKISCVAYNSSERDSGAVQVNVWDGTVPKLSLPQSFEVKAENEQGAYVKFDASATDDIDGALRVTCDRLSGSLFPNGRTRVNCEAVDNALNPAYGWFEVFVHPLDPGVLQIKVPEGVKAEAPDKHGVNVWFDVSAYGSADPDPVVECTPASGSFFNVGDTKVTCVATDDFGARAEGRFVVSVYVGSFMTASDIDAEATSPSGAEVTWTTRPDWKAAIVCSPAAGSLFSFGETSVECSSTNESGESISESFNVRVADTTAPHIENVRAVVGELDAERKIVPVTVEVETIDAGDAAPRCSVTTLAADVPVEWNATSALSFEVRAGANAARSLRAQITCVDASGNRSTTNVPLSIAKGRPVKVN